MQCAVMMATHRFVLALWLVVVRDLDGFTASAQHCSRVTCANKTGYVAH